MRITAVCLTITFIILNNTILHAAEKQHRVLFDFDDPSAAELNWVTGYTDNPELAIKSETTANNFKLAMTMKGGKWPGFTLPVPTNWSGYEAFRFEAFSAGPVTLTVRIDDPGSKDYNSRFHHTFKLKPGRNLCQIELRNVAQKLDIKKIKAAVLFCSNPPEGLVVEMDNFALGALKSEEVPFIPYAERKDLQPSFELVTPHFQCARPLAGGPLKTFFLTSIGQGREVVEMAQRMEIKASVQHWDVSYDQNTWGMGDFYGRRGHKTDYVLMQEYLASSMQGPEQFDSLMLFTPQGWERFGKSAQDAIVKRVREDGVGLVFIFPYSGVQGNTWPENLRSINALIDSNSDYPRKDGYVRHAASGKVKGQRWAATDDHPITRGVPLEALPFENMMYQQYKLAPGARVLITSESGDPILAVREVGKGRVATFAWRGRGLTPAIARGRGEAQLRPYRYWEVIYSLMNRTSLWVARRALHPGDETAVLSDPDERNLRAVLHKNRAGQVTDWQLEFTPPAESTLQTLTLEAPSFINYGEPITGQITADTVFQNVMAEHPEGELTLSLTERTQGRQRTLLQEQRELSELSSGFRFEYASEKVAQIMAVLQVAVHDSGKLVAEGRHEVIVTPEGPLWDDYEILMWHVDGLPFLRDLEDDLVQQFGATGIMETRWYDAGLRMRYARAGLRLMVHDLARAPLQLRDFPELSTEYNKTGNKNLLIRKPSYADSDFLMKERRRVIDAVDELRKFHPTNYILCDEPSLTYYRFDFDYDFHPENILLFRNALKHKFGSIGRLNSCLGTDFGSFSDIKGVTTKSARAKQRWPLWNEWRQHNDNIMAEACKMYKDAVQRADPKGTISLSGTQTATPFDGFDWSKLSPHFGTMQGYGYGDQERKRMSFADGQMINAVPAGYGRSGRAVDYQIWDSVTNHGGGHVLFWWIAFRNPDLSFCQSARDYMRIFKEMKSGIGKQFLSAKRESSPIAIHYSMNSMRYAWTTGADYHAASDACAKQLVAQGYDPVYVSDRQIADGELERRGIKVLFMPASYSIAQGKNQGQLHVLQALQTYARQGGLVFHQEDTVVDEFLSNQQQGLLAFSNKYGAINADVVAVLRKAVPVAVGLSGNKEAVLKKLTAKVHQIKGNSDARIVTVLRPPVGTKEVLGGDGVIHVVSDKSGGNAIESVSVNLSELKPGHVYAMRSGEQLTLNDGSIKLNMQAGDGTPLVLLPYEIKTVDTSCAVTASADLSVAWQLQGGSDYASHVMRIRVLDGDEEDPVLSTNVSSTADGSGSHIIHLSLEDRQRPLRVQVIDVLTGTKSAIQQISLPGTEK